MSYSEGGPDFADASLRAAPTLAIVIPCYNEEEVLPRLLAKLEELCVALGTSNRCSGPVTVVLVDDGSTDRTWQIICKARAGFRIVGLKLSRNHGHQGALLAGLMKADAEVVVSMDADLQDDPNAVAEMIDAYRHGAEIVFGVRASRDTDTRFKRLTARGYYRLLSWLGVDLVPDHADFRLMTRKALAALGSFEESNLYLRGLVRHLGFKTAIVKYDRAFRAAGESKYNLPQMMGLAIDGITSFSVRPLKFITLAGFVVASLSFAVMIYSLASWFLGLTVPGWASTVLPIYFLGGAHLIALGVIGEYVGKIYRETKRRPRFIVDEVIICDLVQDD